jgi:hypothetical protein
MASGSARSGLQTWGPRPNWARTVADPDLSDGDQAGGDLARAEDEGDGELSQGDRAGGGLSEAEEEAERELPDRDHPERRVTDGDHPGGQPPDANHSVCHDTPAGLGADAVGVVEHGHALEPAVRAKLGE